MNAASVWLGLMSGTSVDAIDAVALECSADQRPRLLAHIEHPWPEALRERLRSCPSESPPGWAEWLELDRAVAEQHAAAISTLRRQLPQGHTCAGIGFHGQTIYHHPRAGNTLQLGSPAHLAQACGLPVVADFRRADMAVGGQGAPLAPAFHAALWAHADERLAVLNLGGIANISILDGDQLIAGFDSGPANALMDAWCQRHFACPMDVDGTLARQGQLDSALLERLLQEPYFAQTAPKSTGREYFHLGWLNTHLQGQEPTLDVLRTLLELSARSICDALSQHAVDQVVLVGGGAHNSFLRERLSALLPQIRWSLSTDRGWAVSTIEAGLFAWLAWRHASGLTTPISAATGASRDVILGASYPYSPP